MQYTVIKFKLLSQFYEVVIWACILIQACYTGRVVTRLEKEMP